MDDSLAWPSETPQSRLTGSGDQMRAQHASYTMHQELEKLRQESEARLRASEERLREHQWSLEWDRQCGAQDSRELVIESFEARIEVLERQLQVEKEGGWSPLGSRQELTALEREIDVLRQKKALLRSRICMIEDGTAADDDMEYAWLRDYDVDSSEIDHDLYDLLFDDDDEEDDPEAEFELALSGVIGRTVEHAMADVLNGEYPPGAARYQDAQKVRTGGDRAMDEFQARHGQVVHKSAPEYREIYEVIERRALRPEWYSPTLRFQELEQYGCMLESQIQARQDVEARVREARQHAAKERQEVGELQEQVRRAEELERCRSGDDEGDSSESDAMEVDSDDMEVDSDEEGETEDGEGEGEDVSLVSPGFALTLPMRPR